MRSLTYELTTIYADNVKSQKFGVSQGKVGESNRAVRKPREIVVNEELYFERR
jgi:hypothetical protein